MGADTTISHEPINVLFNKRRYVAALLAGATDAKFRTALSNAFIWAESPQGLSFWHAEYLTGRLSDDARAILEATNAKTEAA